MGRGVLVIYERRWIIKRRPRLAHPVNYDIIVYYKRESLSGFQHGKDLPTIKFASRRAQKVNKRGARGSKALRDAEGAARSVNKIET